VVFYAVSSVILKIPNILLDLERTKTFLN